MPARSKAALALLYDLTCFYYPLPLCLHIGSLDQFPSISDILLYFIIVDRSVSFQQIQVYMQSFSASLVLHTVFCLSADQFVQ